MRMNAGSAPMTRLVKGRASAMRERSGFHAGAASGRRERTAAPSPDHRAAATPRGPGHCPDAADWQ
jgi:hypothetical protein